MEAVSLKKLYDYEIDRSDLVSPEHSLRVALARTGKRSYTRSIFFSWENLEVASRKMAGLISHHYPDPSGEGYLLDKALTAACDVFENTVETESFTRRMALYLKTMVDVTAEGILYWETHGIMSGNTTAAWQVGSLSLHEWAKKKVVERIVFTKRSDKAPSAAECDAAKIALSSGVLSFNDLVHISGLSKEG